MNGLIRSLIPLFTVLLIASCGGGGGGDDNDSSNGTNGQDIQTTVVDVFDGAAIGCTVTEEESSAVETGAGVPGQYIFSRALDTGVIVTASNCTDADTAAKLPTMSGVAQADGVVISPITTLIVAEALNLESGERATASRAAQRITTTRLSQAISRILANLELEDYDPVNPVTANYVAAAKADDVGTSVATRAMRAGLAIATLLKGVEIAAGTDAPAAFSAIAGAIAEASAPVDFSETSGVENTMSVAAAIDTSVASAINTATTAIVYSVSTIGSSTGAITNSIALATAAASVLNGATIETIGQAELISNLTSAVNAALPSCMVGSSTVGGCTIPSSPS